MSLNWVLQVRHINIESVPANLRDILIGKDYTFGRHPSADILLPTKYLSRKRLQCKIIYRRKMLQIVSYSASPRDFPNTPGLTSDENSTYLNREPLVKGAVCTLKEGDVVGMGVHELFNKDCYLYEVTRHQVVPVVKTEVEENDDDVVIISDSEEEQAWVDDAMRQPEPQRPALAVMVDSHQPLPTRRSVNTNLSETSSQASDSTVVAPCFNGPSTSRAGMYSPLKQAQTPTKSPGNSVQTPSKQAEQSRNGNSVQNQKTEQPKSGNGVQTPSKQAEQSRSGNSVQNKSGNSVQNQKTELPKSVNSVQTTSKHAEQPKSGNSVQTPSKQAEQPKSGNSVHVSKGPSKPGNIVQLSTNGPGPAKSGNSASAHKSGNNVEPPVEQSERNDSTKHSGKSKDNRDSKSRKSSVESLIDVSDDSLQSLHSDKHRRESVNLLEDVSDESMKSVHSDKAKSSHKDGEKKSGKHSSKKKHKHKRKHSSDEKVEDSDKKSSKKKESSKKKHSSSDEAPMEVSENDKKSKKSHKKSSKKKNSSNDTPMDNSDNNKPFSFFDPLSDVSDNSTNEKKSSKEAPKDISENSTANGKASKKKKKRSPSEEAARKERKSSSEDRQMEVSKHSKDKKRKSSSNDKEATKAKKRKTEDDASKSFNKNNIVSSSDEEDIEATRLKIKQERRLKKLKRKCKPCSVVICRLTKAEIAVWTTKKKKNRKRILQIVSDVESSPEKVSPPKTDPKPKIVKRFNITDDNKTSKKSVVRKEPVDDDSSSEDELFAKKFTARKSDPKPIAGPSSVGSHRRRTASTSDDEKPAKKTVANPIGDRRRSTFSSSDEDIIPKKLHPRKNDNKSQEPVAGPSNYRKSIDEQPSIKKLPRIPKKSDKLKRSLESQDKSNKKQKVDSGSESPDSVHEMVLPKQNFKLQKKSKDTNLDRSSDSGSVYEFVFEEPRCEEISENIEIKQEPEEINWNDSHYTQDDDDDDVIIIENPNGSQDSHSTTVHTETNLDDEFNIFLSSQREELNNSQVEDVKPKEEKSEDSDSDSEVQPRKPILEPEDSDSDFEVQSRKPMSEKRKLELFGDSEEEDAQGESGKEQEDSESGKEQEESESGQEEPKSPETSGSSDDEKRKHEGPVLIDALPLVPRKRGRHSELPTKAKERKEKILRRVSAEDRMNYQRPLKPKAAFTDKMRNLKGQKVLNKNSNWMPDYDPEDKESKKLMKEQRMKRLKELSKANKQETEAPREPEPSTSTAYVEPCFPSREEGMSMVNKVPVKVTKVNRGSFLTEIPKKSSAKSSNAPLDTSVEKIIVDDQVIVIGKKKEAKTSAAASIPSTSQEAKTSTPPSKASISPAPNPPASQVAKKSADPSKTLPSSASNSPHESNTSSAAPSKVSLSPASNPSTSQLIGSESKVAATSKPSPPPPTTQKMVTPPPTSRKEETVVPKQVDTVLPVPRREEPVLPSVGSAVSQDDDAALPSVSNLTLKDETKTKMDETGLPRPIPVLPRRSCLAGRRASRGSASSRSIKFNDTLDVHDYLIEEGKLMRPVTQSTMLRHHLLDLDNTAVVSEETQRVIHSVLFWTTKWLSEEQSSGIPPPVWRREKIHYTDPQLLAIPTLRWFTPDPDRSTASTKLPWPAQSTLLYGSYEAYHKVWLPLMLLEMWSCVAQSSNDPLLRQSIFSGELSDWRTEDVRNIHRCDTVHVRAPLTLEMAVNTNSPNHGDFVLITLLQENSRDAHRFFGYVEKRRLNQDLAQNSNRVKLHPESMKPIVATMELDIKLRSRDALHVCTKAHIQLLPHARSTLVLIQGLSQLQNSSLRDVILSPTLQNMSHKVPVKRANPFLPTLKEMIKTDLSSEQEKVADSISNLLKCDQPSLSVIEGPPGTGKTRTLIAIAMRILQESLHAAQSRLGVQANEGATLGTRLGTRILIVSSNVEAMNAMAFFLDFINARNSQNMKFKFVVIAKNNELCGEASMAHSLQELLKRARNQDQERLEGDDFDWDTEVNLIEAKVHQERIEVEQARLDKRHDLPQLENKLQELEERLEHARLMNLKPDQVLTQVQQDNKLKNMLRQNQIVVSTIDNLAHSSICKAAFNTRCSFQLPICLIDDAHNISEIQSLLPLTFGASKFVLAGDLSLPPPIIRCKVGADKLGMSQSLLMRVTKALDSQLHPNSVRRDPKFPYAHLHKSLHLHPDLRYHQLRKQHRMPLELTYLTMLYYERERISRPEPSEKHWPFLPFAVIDHKYFQDQRVGNWRTMEVSLVTNILRYIETRVHERMPNAFTNVVVITVEDIMEEKINHELKNTPRPRMCNDWVRMVEHCFADANVVILSLGSQHPENTKVMELSYFLQAITRAKNSLYIVGDMDKYKHKAHWRALLNHANKENRCFTVKKEAPFNPHILEVRSPPPTHQRPPSPPQHGGYAPHHSRGPARGPTPPSRARSPQRVRVPTPHPNYRTTHVRQDRSYTPPTDLRRPPANRPPLLDRPPTNHQRQPDAVNRNPQDQQNNSRPQNQPNSNDFMPINPFQSFLNFGGPNNQS